MCLVILISMFVGRWRENGVAIEPNYRQLVYSFGMGRSGNFETWNWMLDKFKEETNAQEKTKHMKGLVSDLILFLAEIESVDQIK